MRVITTDQDQKEVKAARRAQADDLFTLSLSDGVFSRMETGCRK